MIESELALEEPCGCGSTLPYAECCRGSWGRYVRTASGRVRKALVLSNEAQQAISEAEAHFREIFGRRGGSQDRVLTVPLRHSPQDYRRTFREIAERAGANPVVIYATQETGLLVSEGNIEHLSPTDRRDWEDAISEYQLAMEDGVDF